jgi:hypothetical protein
MLCSLEGFSAIPGVANGNTALNPIPNGSGNGTFSVANGGCNNNWNTWWLGTRTQWNVTPDTYFALEVFYENMTSATSVNGRVPTGGIVSPVSGTALSASGVVPTSTATTGQSVGNNDNWMLRFRVHRDFYP